MYLRCVDFAFACTTIVYRDRTFEDATNFQGLDAHPGRRRGTAKASSRTVRQTVEETAQVASEAVALKELRVNGQLQPACIELENAQTKSRRWSCR